MKEFGRKTIHIIGGLVILLVLSLIGREFFIFLSLHLLFIGLVSIQFEMDKFQVPVFSTIFRLFERKEVVPGKGAIWYAISVIIAIVFFQSPLTELIIICLTIGDGFATLIGRIGNFRNPINKKKTIEGSLWFAASSMLALCFFNIMTLFAFLFIITASIVEALEHYIDDNLRIALLGFFFALVF